MTYYKERNNLFENELNIDFENLKEYFFLIYNYFLRKGSFKIAFEGVERDLGWGKIEQFLPPSMAPSPKIYFLINLHKENKYPIYEAYEDYSEEELFTVIEILYNHIAEYNWKKDEIENTYIQEQFANQMNNLLRFYKSGYILETNHGIIMEIPNKALKELLKYDIPETMSYDTVTKLKTAIKQFYKYNSNEEETLEVKKKAIALLADILESIRTELKDILNEEYEINKNKHDKLIFDVVNEFNIRHDNVHQKTEYSKLIWYEWMMQYYTSVILTYFRLKESKENLT